jgi:hypothetical protein
MGWQGSGKVGHAMTEGNGVEAGAVAVVRLRQGVIGESRRVCHVVPIPENRAVPGHLTALCGTDIYPGQADVLPDLTGMPCDVCMARSLGRGLPCRLPGAGRENERVLAR